MATIIKKKNKRTEIGQSLDAAIIEGRRIERKKLGGRCILYMARMEEEHRPHTSRLERGGPSHGFDPREAPEKALLVVLVVVQRRWYI